MYYNLKEELFMESKAGQKCIEHLEKIQGTTISQKESDDMCYKYTMDFYKETKYHGSFSHICNMFIPYILYRKYNITVDKYKQSIDTTTDSLCGVLKQDVDISENKRKTAPTLIDGWFIYIIVMIGLSIFHARILGWIVATIVFLLWRANEIRKYN